MVSQLKKCDLPFGTFKWSEKHFVAVLVLSDDKIEQSTPVNGPVLNWGSDGSLVSIEFLSRDSLPSGLQKIVEKGADVAVQELSFSELDVDGLGE